MATTQSAAPSPADEKPQNPGSISLFFSNFLLLIVVYLYSTAPIVEEEVQEFMFNT